MHCSKNVKSTFQTVKSSVSQGSILGPVLFILFINDIPVYTNGTDVNIYSDDTAVHASDKDQEIIILLILLSFLFTCLYTRKIEHHKYKGVRQVKDKISFFFFFLKSCLILKISLTGVSKCFMYVCYDYPLYYSYSQANLDSMFGA